MIVVMNFKVTEEEKAIIEKRAKKEGMEVSDYVRSAVYMEMLLSGDPGADAIIFDPDPIRGGKIVIQAKRYTIPVDVSAVRDLYGTVVNEGANTGILVTTSHYGAEAYEFAQNKPLKLITGAQLLGLLEKAGYHFRIDLTEARARAAKSPDRS